MKNLVVDGLSLGWLLEAAADAMAITDQAGTIVLVNPALERMFGYESGSMTGLLIEALVPARFHAVHAVRRNEFFARPCARSSRPPSTPSSPSTSSACSSA